MKNGQAVGDQLAGKRQSLPWFTILDADGKELVNSTDPNGDNIGCPVKDTERAHFVSMIEHTAQRSDANEIKKVESALATYAESL